MNENYSDFSDNNGSGICRQVVVVNQLGLHARPAARLAQEAQKFSSDVLLICEGQEVDAKSILDILTLAAAQGTRMELKACGSDAVDALSHLEDLFKSRFGEERQHIHPGFPERNFGK